MAMKLTNEMKSNFVEDVMKALPMPGGINDKQLCQAIEDEVNKRMPADVKAFLKKYPGGLAMVTHYIKSGNSDWYEEGGGFDFKGAVAQEFNRTRPGHPEGKNYFPKRLISVPHCVLPIAEAVVKDLLPSLRAQFKVYYDGMVARAQYRQGLQRAVAALTTVEALKATYPDLASYAPTKKASVNYAIVDPQLVEGLKAAGLPVPKKEEAVAA